MRIASWNVNSLKVRLPQVIDWLERTGTAVLGLQETKLVDDQFPAEALHEAGYQVIYTGQPTYNGVALISKHELINPVYAIPDFEDQQKRAIAATVNGIRVINLYVVNGQEVGSEKFAYKLRWLEATTEWVRREMAQHEKVVVMGDFNIAPDDRDVYDPEAWRDKILCSKPERDALRGLLDLGLHDSFRLFDQPEKTWSWWDYRAAMFRRGLGLRIDLVLVSDTLKDHCTTSYIDKEPRKNERPSDHAPAVGEFSI